MIYKVLVCVVITALVAILGMVESVSPQAKSVRTTFTLTLLRMILILSGCLIALSMIPSMQSSWDVILKGSGVIAIVLGLAAQTSLGNLFAGFFILASHPFEIGDRIQIGTLNPGFVSKLTIHSTILHTYTGEEITVPNSVVASSVVTNFSHIEGFSYPIEVQVAYGTNLELAKHIIQCAIMEDPHWYGVKEPAVLVKEAGDSGILLKTLVTTKFPDNNPQVCSDCLERVLQEFEKDGIEIPYPTTDVHLRQEN